jgi:hypothetical protein
MTRERAEELIGMTVQTKATYNLQGLKLSVLLLTKVSGDDAEGWLLDGSRQVAKASVPLSEIKDYGD